MVETIRVRIPGNNIPERRYAISALFTEVLGLAVEISVDDVVDYEIDLGNRNHITVRDHFFGQHPESLSYLQETAIPTSVATQEYPHAPEATLPIIFGTSEYSESPEQVTCGVDLFASAFFMLTRWEEHVIKERDEHGRIPAIRQLAVLEGFSLRPAVNEFAETLWGLMQAVGYSPPRGSRSFRVVPTHDIDRLYSGNTLANVWKALLNLNVKRAVATAYYKIWRVDPFQTIRHIMQLSEDRGLQSRFYFIPGGSTDKEGYYDIGTPKVEQLLGEILNRGHVVGFHPSYETHLDEPCWLAEKNRLDGFLPTPCAEGRQHYLRFENPETWRMWDRNAIRVDSTMGYADRIGFRCGTGDTFPVFDILKRETMALREQPLIVMDSALMKIPHKGDRRAALEQVTKVSSRYSMPLTVLFHNHTLDPTAWNRHSETYVALLDSCREGSQ